MTVHGPTDHAPSEEGPFDPGLQPERTELAWRRTALAIAIGSVVSLRIFPLVLPAAAAGWGLVPGAVGVIAACGLWIAARRRQRQMTATFRASLQPGSPRAVTPGGGMLLALTVLATAFGAAAITIVLAASFVDSGV